jgi:hypothetical protein
VIFSMIASNHIISSITNIFYPVGMGRPSGT